jgi:hypothetical protein
VVVDLTGLEVAVADKVVLALMERMLLASPAQA